MKIIKKLKYLAVALCLVFLSACVAPDTTPKYKVVFLDDEGEEIATVFVKEGAEVEAPDPEKEGYNFIGWDQSIENITEDTTVRAIYEKKSFIVYFKDGDEILSVQNVLYNEAAIPPVINKEGYRFQKWDQEYTHITSDIEIRAVFAIREYQVRFMDVDGKIISSQYVKYLEAATAPEEIEVPHYKFIGWDQPFDSVTSDMLIKGVYEKEESVVRFFNGKKQLFEEYIRPIGEEYVLPTPELEGYYFIGWFLSDKSLTEYKKIAADDINDYNFYARFVETSAHENTRITLPDALYHFTKINQVPNGSGTYVFQPEMPAGAPGSVTDYDWTSSNPKVATVSVWSSVTAKTAGYAIITATYNYNKEIKINCIVKCGVDGVRVATEEEANTRDVVTVTFLGKEGEVISTTKTIVGSNVLYPVPPIYEGYKFVGWDKQNYDIQTDTEIRAFYEKGTNKYTGKTISILGDSISTFDGYIPDGYRVFYPYATGDVRDINQTWWMKTANQLGATILSNNSYSGSCVAGGSDSAASTMNRLKTLKMQDVTPDVIIIYMGTNDTGGFTVQNFAAAYDAMLKNIKELCPTSEIVVCTLPISKCYPVSLQTSFNAAMIEKANKYGATIVDLEKVDLTKKLIDSAHPKESGMDLLASYIVNALLKK